jgi:hypothetical protein
MAINAIASVVLLIVLPHGFAGFAIIACRNDDTPTAALKGQQHCRDPAHSSVMAPFTLRELGRARQLWPGTSYVDSSHIGAAEGVP